jgi:hypothetical protein
VRVPSHALTHACARAHTHRKTHACVRAHTTLQLRTDVHARYDAMARFNPEKASQVASHIRNIDALTAQVRAANDLPCCKCLPRSRSQPTHAR